jgi:hypothetical protein
MNGKHKTPQLFWPGKSMHGSVVLNFMNRPASEFSLYAAAFWHGGNGLLHHSQYLACCVSSEQLGSSTVIVLKYQLL